MVREDDIHRTAPCDNELYFTVRGCRKIDDFLDGVAEIEGMKGRYVSVRASLGILRAPHILQRATDLSFIGGVDIEVKVGRSILLSSEELQSSRTSNDGPGRALHPAEHGDTFLVNETLQQSDNLRVLSQVFLHGIVRSLANKAVDAKFLDREQLQYHVVHILLFEEAGHL